MIVYGGAEQNKMLSEKELYKQLEKCLMINADAQRVGILTTDNRNNWGEAYEELIKGKQYFLLHISKCITLHLCIYK